MTKPKQRNRVIVRGIKASSGIITGKAWIIRQPTKVLLPKSGAVIVTTFTTPVIAAAIIQASAIICEKGGVTSHAAIIAREFNIPCIVGATGALNKIKDHQVVIVNASHGVVFDGS